MNNNRRIGFILLLILNFSVSYGQEYFAETREIGMEEGLSHYKVLAFYPEDDGMWIGTDDGLNFHDGYGWKYWNKDKGQLTKKEVNFIHKDQNDFLWLFNTKKTHQRKDVRSIDILTADRDSIFSFEQKIGNLAPFEISDLQNFFEDQNKHLYFFAKNQLWRYASNGLFDLVRLPDGFKPYSILSDNHFVGEINGQLAIVSPKGDLLSTSDYALNDDDLFTILGTHQKIYVWQDQALAQIFEKLANGKYKVSDFPIQQDRREAFSFVNFDEKKNQIWVTKGEELFLFDKNEKQLLKQESNTRVGCIDKDDNFWMGDFNVTILRLQERRFKKYLHLNKKINKEVFRCRGIYEKKGKLYVNTYKGLKIIDLENEKLLPSPLEIDINYQILNDHKDQLWTAYRKVFRLNESGDQTLETLESVEESGEAPRVWSLFEDVDHRIWIGKMGLAFIEKGELQEFKKYNGFEGLAEGIVLFFYKDKNGVIWVGSNKGLYQLDPKKGIISCYGKNREGAFQLPSSKFQHMYQDAQGVFWMTTEDAGLIRWDKATGEIEQFDKTHGFLTNNIYSVYEDDFKNLWLSSFNGIIRFQKESKNFTIYNEEDGISDNEFNRISHFQSEDGHIYFGGQNGITSFHPNNFQKEKFAEKEFELVLNHTSIFGSKAFKDQMADGSKIDLMNLGAGTRVIDFEIVSPNMFWTDKVDLHYTLEPIGNYKKTLPTFKEKISSDHHVELFGMHPGTYELKVKAIQKNGKQLGETMSISMKISKPIFHTTIFWVFVFVGTVLSIWVLIKIRTTHLKRRQEELEKLVKERTEQIFNDQKIIQTQTEQIEAMKERLDRKDELWLEQFQFIVNERLDDPDLYLPDIIDKLEISRSIFYEKVKSLTRMTPNQYIQELRLNKAKEMLELGDVKTVKEVSSSVGMKRPSYFSKLYKERFGILPSAYFNSNSN